MEIFKLSGYINQFSYQVHVDLHLNNIDIKFALDYSNQALMCKLNGILNILLLVLHKVMTHTC